MSQSTTAEEINAFSYKLFLHLKCLEIKSNYTEFEKFQYTFLEGKSFQFDIDDYLYGKNSFLSIHNLKTDHFVELFASKVKTNEEKLALAKLAKLNGIYLHLRGHYNKDRVMMYVAKKFQSNALKLFGYTLIKSKPFIQNVAHPVSIKHYLQNKLTGYLHFRQNIRSLTENRMFTVWTINEASNHSKREYIMKYGYSLFRDMHILRKVAFKPNANLKMTDFIDKGQFLKTDLYDRHLKD